MDLGWVWGGFGVRALRLARAQQRAGRRRSAKSKIMSELSHPIRDEPVKKKKNTYIYKKKTTKTNDILLTHQKKITHARRVGEQKFCKAVLGPACATKISILSTVVKHGCGSTRTLLVFFSATCTKETGEKIIIKG